MKHLILILTKEWQFHKADTILDELMKRKQRYDYAPKQHLDDQLDKVSHKGILDAVEATDFKPKSPNRNFVR
ncbi:MAG: hypothetical protein EZS28_049279 [Streblomastix strix]|uniref:Uncharacterized protein n=1 Tax=Streblomastix strix TaxID=222440 RepID=A0A5J4T9V8_9EUKA|nr:MAG: hypothetical protein EZS28_049279 [Streblomastix strix]